MREFVSAEPRCGIMGGRRPRFVLACWSTAPGGERAAMLSASMRNYSLHCPCPCEMVAAEARSLGEGWTAALEQAGRPWREYDYVHLLGDDVFVQQGFLDAARPWLARGVAPTPRMLGPNGELQRSGGAWAEETPPGKPARLLMCPLLAPAMLEACLPLPPIVLYMDFWITQRLREAGFEVVYEPGYVIRHLVTSSGEDSRPDDPRLFTEAGGRL